MAKIIGSTTATTIPRSDWNQVDENKADYILNKPDVALVSDITNLQSELDTKASQTDFNNATVKIDENAAAIASFVQVTKEEINALFV